MHVGRRLVLSAHYSLFMGSDSGFPLVVVLESIFDEYI